MSNKLQSKALEKIQQTTQEFTQKLRAIMQVVETEDIKLALVDLAQILRKFEYDNVRVGNLSAYDQRKYQAAFDKMQTDLAKVRRLKLPRKQFKFASRKFLEKAQQVMKDEAHEVEFKDDNAIQNVDGKQLELSHITGDFTIRKCANSKLFFGKMQTLYLIGLQNCAVTIQNISGALYVEDCINVQITAEIHQLRVHDTQQAAFQVFAHTSPIIENCGGLKFQELKVGGESSVNFWNHIRNFSFLKAGIQDLSYEFVQ